MARATALEVVRDLTPDERFDRYLDAADDDIVACKAGNHSLPKLKSGDLPPGTSVHRVAGGLFDVTVYCRDCGVPATLRTGRGGIFDPAERWEFDYAAKPGYLAPKGTGRGRKGQYREELGRRAAPSIRRAAAKTTAEKRAAAASKAAKTPRRHNPGNQHGTNPQARRATREGERAMRREREQRGDTA